MAIEFLHGSTITQKHTLPAEMKGWHGYIEWESSPDVRLKAAEILSKYKFASVDARYAFERLLYRNTISTGTSSQPDSNYRRC